MLQNARVNALQRINVELTELEELLEELHTTVKNRQRIVCPTRVRASSFLDSLGLTPVFFDTEQDRCFCEQCVNDLKGSSIDAAVLLPASMLQCSQIYELPHGFDGFGIQMSPRDTSCEEERMTSVLP